ncbi:MAG: DtxR family transcriptional regulator [Ramlibacter sp.]|jgi:DtxR family Mn-dependent transcriptional regulator|nr:DtxR family transcriptional regulator [Ramlibacter sp.]
MAEDYVRLLWKAEERGSGPLATRDIAAALGVSNTTVSTNLRKLDLDGLIEHEPYHLIALTDQGRRLAVAVVRRHRLIETLLQDHLGYTWDQVHGEAEVMEHAVSDLFIDRVESMLGFPTTDPHGDPIPTQDGAVDDVVGQRLSTVPDGWQGHVVRVLDDDADALAWLTEHAVGLGTAVRVVRRRLGGSLHQVEVSVPTPESAVDGLDTAAAKRQLDVPAVVARIIWVASPLS